MKSSLRYILAAALLFLAVAGISSADSDKRLSPQESVAAAVNKPQPEYPAIAKQLRLEGAVRLNAFVSEEGVVERVETVSGNPILARPAQDALLRWRFTKQMADGKPVKFVATVVFDFKQ